MIKIRCIHHEDIPLSSNYKVKEWFIINLKSTEEIEIGRTNQLACVKHTTEVAWLDLLITFSTSYKLQPPFSYNDGEISKQDFLPCFSFLKKWRITPNFAFNQAFPFRNRERSLWKVSLFLLYDIFAMDDRIPPGSEGRSKAYWFTSLLTYLSATRTL